MNDMTTNTRRMSLIIITLRLSYVSATTPVSGISIIDGKYEAKKIPAIAKPEPAYSPFSISDVMASCEKKHPKVDTSPDIHRYKNIFLRDRSR